MIKSLALIGTLSINFTLLVDSAFASEPLPSRQIVCVETGSDSETHVTSKIGEITVTLDEKRQPHLVHINRQGHSDIPAINKTFDIKAKSIVKNEIITAISDKPVNTSGISKFQVITASDSGRRSLVLKINDQFQSGLPVSSFVYEYGKIHVSSAEETTLVTCEGDLHVQLNSTSSVALDKQIKK